MAPMIMVKIIVVVITVRPMAAITPLRSILRINRQIRSAPNAPSAATSDAVARPEYIPPITTSTRTRKGQRLFNDSILSFQENGLTGFIAPGIILVQTIIPIQ